MSRFVCFCRPLYCALPFAHKANVFDSTDDRRLQKLEPVTGIDRLYIMFSIDVNGLPSKEVVSITQISLASVVGGAVVGGILHSKDSAHDFIERNQTARFVSAWEAKRKLQDYVIVKFYGGAFRWGFKCGMFAFFASSIITVIGVYRGKPSVWEYMLAGALCGGATRMYLGLRGAIGGAVLGTLLGTVCGSITLLSLMIGRTTMDDVREWQYNMKKKRAEAIKALENPHIEKSPDLVRRPYLIPGINEHKERTDVYLEIDQPVEVNTSCSSEQISDDKK